MSTSKKILKKAATRAAPIYRRCPVAGTAPGRRQRDARHAATQESRRLEAPDKRRNPIDILKKSNRDRLPELVPIRYGRMLRSPFTFLRGSAGLMAHDLATTPSTGLRVQACGDCHLMNFGLFATPERNLVFDINDFDETLPAPWEWDRQAPGGELRRRRPRQRLLRRRGPRVPPSSACAPTGSTCASVRR